ncbi:MAG: DedA family protein [Candidatus Gracilibacteria bacterium]
MFTKIIDFILHIDSYLSLIIDSYGNLIYGILFTTIFLETGLVVTPFLPGDSLIFVAGTFASSGLLNVYLLFALIAIAAILGDTINYTIGKKFGEKVFAKFIKKEHMQKTKDFYKKYGKKTIVLARFVPIVRTLAPFIAGVGEMEYKTFISYNIIGGISWVAIFLFTGYFFGNFTFVKENLTAITLLVIFVSILPAIIEVIRSKRQ